jgi:hypothetical protein
MSKCTSRDVLVTKRYCAVGRADVLDFANGRASLAIVFESRNSNAEIVVTEIKSRGSPALMLKAGVDVCHGIADDMMRAARAFHSADVVAHAGLTSRTHRISAT